MSLNTCRTVRGGRSRVASYIGRLIPAIRKADSAKVRASKPSNQAGWTNASSTPTADGMAISTTLGGCPGHRVRLGDPLAPDQRRQGAEDRTVEEHADRRAEEGDRKDVRDGQLPEQVRQRDGRHEQGAQDVRGDHHLLAVPAVGQRAGEQPEQQVRCGLRRRHQRRQARRSGRPVDDDRQGHQRDDAARDREQAGGEVPQELLVAEDRGRIPRGSPPAPHPTRAAAARIASAERSMSVSVVVAFETEIRIRRWWCQRGGADPARTVPLDLGDDLVGAECRRTRPAPG